MSSLILSSVQGPLATIKFNRPDKLNAFTPEMYVDLGDTLDRIERDENVRVVLISGEGRAFSSGFDINVEITERPQAIRRNFIVDVANANRWKIWNSSKLVVAAVHGYCLGGAFELMLPMDFSIVSEDCVLGEPDATFGLGPAFLMLPWLVGPPVAKAIILGGLRFSGSDAARWGIVTQAVPSAELDRHVEATVDRLLRVPRNAARTLKAGINRAYDARGMRAAIESWVESSIFLESTDDPETAAFKHSVQQHGLRQTLVSRREDKDL